MADHPRHELELDADALARVALIADYFEELALQDGDVAHAEDVSVDAEVLRRWETLCREARTDVRTRQMKDGS